MSEKSRLTLLLFAGLWLLLGLQNAAFTSTPNNCHALEQNGLDSIPRESLVLVEAFDSKGQSISVSIGVIVKKGFVALNYHYLVGAAEVNCFRPGETQRFASNGYLSVEEEQDLIVISVPTLVGKIALLGDYDFPATGKNVQLSSTADPRRMLFGNAIVQGNKEILGHTLPQMVSNQIEDCTGGPIFQGNKVVGFTVAGYLDDKRFYAYGVPIYELKRLFNRSFIIKTYSSESEMKPTATAPFQANLMESLEAVLWQSIPSAEKLAAKKNKMIIIDLSTKWAGWSSLMEKNTYSKKSIIRYLNENFYAVRLDAETSDTILFNRQTYYRNSGSPYHALAYSLLEGNMQFPSTVILDEDVNELLVIPGYMDAKKMEVMLHYFFEKAYLKEQISFQQFEISYWQRQQIMEGN